MVTLFQPEDGQNLLGQYPELREYPEFESIKPKELLFVWNYCNFKREGLKPNESAYQAYIAVYGETKDKIQSDFVNGNFKFEIKAAIRVMDKFSIPYRVKAKKMAQTMFANIEKALDDGEIDPDKYKKFSDLLPSLLKQIEQGFGIREQEEKANDKKEPTYADKLLSDLNDY